MLSCNFRKVAKVDDGNFDVLLTKEVTNLWKPSKKDIVKTEVLTEQAYDPRGDNRRVMVVHEDKNSNFLIVVSVVTSDEER